MFSSAFRGIQLLQIERDGDNERRHFWAGNISQQGLVVAPALFAVVDAHVSRE